MEIITKTIDEKFDLPENHCVFDIETTGLSHSNSKVILIGMLFVKDGKTHIKQIFAENRHEEKELLFYFKELFKTFKGHISYNGFSFDIPFLNARFKKNKMSFNIQKESGVDILRIVRSRKELLGLESCRLKDVERAMGIQRDDSISGKESVELYDIFEQTSDPKLKKAILLHNHDDIYYLSKLWDINSLIKDKLLKNSLPVKINSQDSNAFMESFKIKGLGIHVKHTLIPGISMPFEIFEKNFSIRASENELEMKLDLVRIQDSEGARILAFDAGSLVPVKKDVVLEENIRKICSFILKAVSSL